LPIPGSPVNRTSSGRPSNASRTTRSIIPSSIERPTNAIGAIVTPCARVARADGHSADHPGASLPKRATVLSGSLYRRSEPEKSPIGLAVAVIALVAMPLPGGAKLRVGRAIGSRALVADAKETFACGWLSAAVVVGVVDHDAPGL
jgi:divalent metal cation (Fe/Co/Zn/Cd) transporter